MSDKPQRTFQVKDSIRLEDGVHNGTIVRIEYRDEPYQYVEVIVRVDNTELELSYGCPQNLSKFSKLGKLMEMFGRELEVNETITENDIEDLFVGERVKFMTMTEVVKKDNQSREFARIVDDSLKPLK